MCWRTDRRGMGLVETLIALGLAGVLFGLVASLLSPVLHTMQQTSARVEMEEECNLSLFRLDTDVRATSPLSTFQAWTPPGEVIGLTRVQDVTPGALTRLWETQVVLYVWNTAQQTLTRSTLDGSASPLSLNGSAPAALNPPLLTTLSEAKTLSSAVTATGVTAFSMTPTPSANLWSVTLSMHRDPSFDLTATRTIGGRN